jgi:hypothetical protein
MDNKAPMTKEGGKAVPARDEAKARSANAVPAVRTSVPDSGARAGYSRARGSARTQKAHSAFRGRGHGGAVQTGGTVRSFPHGSKSGHAQQVPARRPVGAGAGGEVSGTVATCNRPAGPLPNPADEPGAVESVSVPQGAEAWSGGGFVGSRRQKRRDNAKARAHTLSEGTPLDAPTSGPGTVQTKRQLGASGDSSLFVSDSKRAKVSASFAEVAASERMAIVPEAFPAEKIGLGHLGAIQGLILGLLVEAPDPLPRVTLGNVVAGALHVNCQGRESVTWLRSAIGSEEIAGLRLRVMDAKDLPKPVKMAWKTKIVGGHDVKLLLRVLQRYNPALHTEEWKVVDTLTSDANTRRIILMDRVSADVIKAAGYHLHTGVDLSSFKLLEDAEERALEGAEEGTCAGTGAGGPTPGEGAGGPPPGEVEEGTPLDGEGPTTVGMEAEEVEAAEEGGQSEAETGDRAGSSCGLAESRRARESSPLSVIGSEDLQGMAELYLEASMSPMSCDETVQEVAADLSKPKN